MISSGGTRNGRSFCGAAFGEQAAPAAPAVSASRKKFRRVQPSSSRLTRSSLVAGPAVGGRLAPVLRVLVAAEAPAHRERRHLAHRVHLLDLAVALRAGELRGDHVALVREEDVVRHAVDAGPLDGLALVEHPPQRLQLLVELRVLLVLLHELVAALAARHRGDARHRPALRVGVARRAADLGVAGVHLVAEPERLRGRRGGARQGERRDRRGDDGGAMCVDAHPQRFSEKLSSSALPAATVTGFSDAFKWEFQMASLYEPGGTFLISKAPFLSTGEA